MNIKELRQVRKELVQRFGMATNAPTTEVVKRLIDEERIFAEYPQDIKHARRFLKTRQLLVDYGKSIKPIPSGQTRQDVGL